MGAEIFFSPVKWPLLAAGHPETGPLVWTGLWSALYWTAAPDHTTRKSKRLWSPKTLCFCRIVYILYYFPWSSLAACQLQGCIFHLHFGLFFCTRFYILYYYNSHLHKSENLYLYCILSLVSNPVWIQFEMKGYFWSYKGAIKCQRSFSLPLHVHICTCTYVKTACDVLILIDTCPFQRFKGQSEGFTVGV